MGPWSWDLLSRRLRDRGHRVHAVALSGLDADAGDVSGIDLEAHVNDVLAVLETEDLTDVVLVAHGTSGVIAGVVTDRVPDRVRHTVYIEGMLAANGKATLDAFPPALQADELRLIAEHDGRWPVPDATVVADGQGLSPEQAEWLVSRFVPHPGRALSEPAVLKHGIGAQRSTYIVCAKEHFSGALADDIKAMRDEPLWTFHTIDSGIWPMISAPDELAELLDGVATGPEASED